MAFSPIIWLAIGIIIMACEIVTPGFIIFWFGAGGILTAIFIFLRIIPPDNAELQWLFFFLSSIALLGLWQTVLRKKIKNTRGESSRDETLNKLRGRTTAAIAPGMPGEVELYSVYHGIKKWQAESGEVIESGIEIEVVEASGIKLIVKKI